MGLKTLIWAEPEIDGEMVTGLAAGPTAGGVHTPALVMMPTLLLLSATVLTCHVTAVFVRFATFAVKVTVLPKRTWLAPLKVTDGCGGLFPPELLVVLLEHPLAKMIVASRDTKAIRTWERRESCPRDRHGDICLNKHSIGG
jgi:hypothetical protein